MPDLFRCRSAPCLALAGLALCLASTPGEAMPGYPAYRAGFSWNARYGVRARPAPRPVLAAQPRAKAPQAKVQPPQAKAQAPQAKSQAPQAKSQAPQAKSQGPKAQEPKTSGSVGKADSAESSAAWSSGEQPGRACSRGRRKLWQDGEGWVVKKVNLCP